MTRNVRTTMQPDVDIEVSDEEYLDLHRQGLIKGQKDRPLTDQSLETEKAHGVAPKNAGKESK